MIRLVNGERQVIQDAWGRRDCLGHGGHLHRVAAESLDDAGAIEFVRRSVQDLRTWRSVPGCRVSRLLRASCEIDVDGGVMGAGVEVEGESAGGSGERWSDVPRPVFDAAQGFCVADVAAPEVVGA